jgi:hypothetical protein
LFAIVVSLLDNFGRTGQQRPPLWPVRFLTASEEEKESLFLIREINIFRFFILYARHCA